MEFITEDEKRHLEEKLAELRAKRPLIVERIAEARALGDLRENAEYHAAREDQGMNEAEVRRLEERLASARVVSPNDVPADVVFIGATVKLRDPDGDEELYRLVGESTGRMEGDVIEVTATSPMGEALMKARVGETVRVDAPRGVIKFLIVEIV